MGERETKAERAERRRQEKVRRAKRRRADRALCPVTVSGILGLGVSRVAAAMRAAGVDTPLTVEEARAYKTMSAAPPEWLSKLFAETAVRAAERVARRERQEFHRDIELTLVQARVEEKLLLGKKIRGYDEELFATDFAFRAMKDLVGCNGDVSWLSTLDLQALRWAGVDPDDRDTWFLQAGG